MKIKMLMSIEGADALPNGRTLGVKFYRAGEVVEVGNDLGKAFCDMKAAEMVIARPAKEAKRIPAAPENK